MTLYLLIGLSWVLVALAVLVLWLVKEREPESQWRLLALAAAAPFVLFPVAAACGFFLEKAVALVPLLDSVWPLAALTGGGAAVGMVRSIVILGRQRTLLASCRLPEPTLAKELHDHLRRLSRAAGLHRVPRVLLYPRGAYICALGGRRPTIVISRDLLTILGDEELEAVLGHEVAHLRQRDYLLNWLGLIARSVLFFLPPWSVAWPVLAEARERRADRLAASYTANPLALGAALIKVWQHSPQRVVTVGALSFLERAGDLEARVRRLLEPTPPTRPVWRSWLSTGLLAGGLLFVQTTVEGGTHFLARVSPEIAAWEQCCDSKVSPFPHCEPPRRVFLGDGTIACSRRPEGDGTWTS